MKIKGIKSGKVTDVVGDELEKYANIAIENKLLASRYLKIIGLSKGGDDEDYVLDDLEDKEIKDLVHKVSNNNVELTTLTKAKEDLVKMLEEAKKTVEVMEKGLVTTGGKIENLTEDNNKADEISKEKTKLSIYSWL